jgi:hypothetical protein
VWPFVLEDLSGECAGELRDTLIGRGPDTVGSTLLAGARRRSGDAELHDRLPRDVPDGVAGA